MLELENLSPFERAMLESQLRSQAIMEAVLKSQTRILSKVKKERYESTHFGMRTVVEQYEDNLRVSHGLERKYDHEEE